MVYYYTLNYHLFSDWPKAYIEISKSAPVNTVTETRVSSTLFLAQNFLGPRIGAYFPASTTRKRKTMTFSRALLLAKHFGSKFDCSVSHSDCSLCLGQLRPLRSVFDSQKSYPLSETWIERLFYWQASTALTTNFSPEGVHQGGNWWPLSLANIIKIKHALQLKDAVLKERYAYVKDTAVYFRKSPEIDQSKSFWQFDR